MSRLEARRSRIGFAALALWLAFPASALAQSSHLVIVVGLAGDPEHGELFQKWGTTLASTATEKLGVPQENVTLLMDAAATKDGVVKALGTLAAKAGEQDTVLIVLFGHGTYANGRVIVAATRTGGEMFATLFGGPFVEAFAKEAADEDKDGKISILEAFDYARKSVAASYQREGLLPTEHPILDDNGDKEGSLDPGRQAKDGQSAAVLSIGSMRRSAAPVNDKLRALYAERDAIERRIESLKLLKSGTDPTKYSQELEKLATELALKTREIKAAEGGK